MDTPEKNYNRNVNASLFIDFVEFTDLAKTTRRDITGFVYTMFVKENLSDDDSAAKITKTGILTDAEEGEGTIGYTGAESLAALEVGKIYYYTIKRVPSADIIDYMLEGTIDIKENNNT